MSGEPIPVESIPWKRWSKGKRFGSRFRNLTLAAVGNAYHVGVRIEELEPGKQSSPAHYHHLEEEHLLVLAGNVTLRLGKRPYALGPGDYVCFPAGQKAAHCLINESPMRCRLLVMGENKPNEVCVYPDSKKIFVRAERRLYGARDTPKYWDGEDAGASRPSRAISRRERDARKKNRKR